LQSWDEIAKVQQYTTNTSQTQHNIGLVAAAPATPTPTYGPVANFALAANNEELQ